MKIGIISDTHGLLRPAAASVLAGVDHILHAGDIGRPEVIAGLQAIAPTRAIRGNIDSDGWAARYPEHDILSLAGHTIYLIHNLDDLDIDPVDRGIDIVVS